MSARSQWMVSLERGKMTGEPWQFMDQSPINFTKCNIQTPWVSLRWRIPTHTKNSCHIFQLLTKYLESHRLKSFSTQKLFKISSWQASQLTVLALSFIRILHLLSQDVGQLWLLPLLSCLQWGTQSWISRHPQQHIASLKTGLRMRFECSLWPSAD